MRKTKIFSIIICVAMLVTLMPAPTIATDKIIDVGTVAELRAALENDTGAHVRLTKDISFTKSNAADEAFGVNLGSGCYTIDLNGFSLQYNYRTGGEFSENGVPVKSHEAKLLVINGPGSMTGGTHGLEQSNQFGTLIVNGGNFKGVMGHGIRITGGIAYINAGSITGNFGGIELEDGLLILNGGDVKSVRQTNMPNVQAKKRGIIKGGVFTGNVLMEDITLYVDNLTIDKGSSMKLIRGAGVIVKNSFVNNGTFTHEGGMKSVGGEAIIKPSQDGNHTTVEIMFDTSFKSLDIQERAHLRILNGATVTVNGAFSSGKDSSIEAKNGTLKLLGSINHNGRAEGVPELGEQPIHNGGGSSGRDYIKETESAYRLKELGLFQGVGTNPDGSTNFDLARVPSRTEALVMLIRLLGKENEAMNGSWRHPFTDVPGWADKYIGYAYEKGLTKGVSATEFGTGMASVQMYLTFALRALGYFDGPGGDFTWGAPERFAQGVRILPEGVYIEDFRRADMVLISEATLYANLKDTLTQLIDKLIEDGAVRN